VRWAALESAQILFDVLRDHHVRALHPAQAAAWNHAWSA
jgi:hypothetical protein